MRYGRGEDPLQAWVAWARVVKFAAVSVAVALVFLSLMLVGLGALIALLAMHL